MRTRAATARPSDTAIEHIRPPIDRPPTATAEVGTPSRLASAEVANRTDSMQTSGGSGLRRPAVRPGNSIRSTATPRPVTAPSTAMSAGWSRPAPAPGVSSNPAMPAEIIRPAWPRDYAAATVRRPVLPVELRRPRLLQP